MSKVLVMHEAFNPLKKIRTTVAGKIEGDSLLLSASRCSEKDQFSKKLGREIATGRLKNPLITDKIIDNASKINQFVSCATEIINNIDDYLLHQSKKQIINEKEITLDA